MVCKKIFNFLFMNLKLSGYLNQTGFCYILITGTRWEMMSHFNCSRSQDPATIGVHMRVIDKLNFRFFLYKTLWLNKYIFLGTCKANSWFLWDVFLPISQTCLPSLFFSSKLTILPSLLSFILLQDYKDSGGRDHVCFVNYNPEKTFCII